MGEKDAKIREFFVAYRDKEKICMDYDKVDWLPFDVKRGGLPKKDVWVVERKPIELTVKLTKEQQKALVNKAGLQVIAGRDVAEKELELVKLMHYLSMYSKNPK